MTVKIRDGVERDGRFYIVQGIPEQLVPAREWEAQKNLVERANHERDKVTADAVFELELTGTEKRALSWAFADKHPESLYDEYANGAVLSWLNQEKVPGHVREQVAGLKTALDSLRRFGFTEQYHLTNYEAPNGEIIPFESHEEKCIAEQVTGTRLIYKGWGYNAGYHWRITDRGRERIKRINAWSNKCCGGCVKLFCVCAEKTYCAVHGGGCHGSHD